MKALLDKHAPKDPEERKRWEESWRAASHLLTPLAKAIQEQLAAVEEVRPDEFALPNHYAKLMYQEGGKAKLRLILDMLPESAKS